MTLRLVRTLLVTLLLVGTTACGLGGGGNGDPCAGVADDEPTSFAVSSTNLDDPDVLSGCIDSDTDADSFDLTGQDIGTGTLHVLECFAEDGVAEFDTPASTAFVACTPTGSDSFAHGAETPTDLVVRAQAGSTGGAYRLELVVA